MIHNSVVVPITTKPQIKITFNEEKCYKCNSRNIFHITNDGGSLSRCVNCGEKLVLFIYIDQKEYVNIINKKFETKIEKESFNTFISKNI